MALSLFRKYRPETFADVVGQEHIERTLALAVANGKTAAAYLFCGPRGTGKTTTARLLAKAMLCEHPQDGEPDDSCPQCREISAGIHPDVYELDAASRTGVDNVREEIISRVAFAPTRGNFKFYIIDEVHMLSTAAFNALLKTLEEPPSHIRFVLCTTDPQKVPETIQSRCQRFDFHRLSVAEIVVRLDYICRQEGFEFDTEALTLIASHARGGMRDAIVALEQTAVFGNGYVSIEAAESLLGEVPQDQLYSLAGLIADNDVASCFAWVASFTQGGLDIAQFARALTKYLRDLYVLALLGGSTDVAGLLELDANDLARFHSQALQFGSVERLGYCLEVMGALNQQLKSTVDARLELELALVRMSDPLSSQSLAALTLRVLELENRLAGLTFGEPGALQAKSIAPLDKSRVERQPDAADEVAFAVTAVPVSADPAAFTAPAVEVAAPDASVEPALPPAASAPVAPPPTDVVSAPTSRLPAKPAVPVAPETTAATSASTKRPVKTLEAPLASGLKNDEDAQRLWQAVMRYLQSHKLPRLSSLLASTQAYLDTESNGMLVMFPESRGFALQSVTGTSAFAQLEEILKEVNNTPVVLKLGLGTCPPSSTGVTMAAGQGVSSARAATTADTVALPQAEGGPAGQAVEGHVEASHTATVQADIAARPGSGVTMPGAAPGPESGAATPGAASQPESGSTMPTATAGSFDQVADDTTISGEVLATDRQSSEVDIPKHQSVENFLINSFGTDISFESLGVGLNTAQDTRPESVVYASFSLDELLETGKDQTSNGHEENDERSPENAAGNGEGTG